MAIEHRDEKMVSHKPYTEHVNNADPIPNTPLLSDIFTHNLQQWPSKVIFRGWKLPQKKWEEWVERLARKYCRVWEKAGICDAILSSVFEIRRNENLVLGLSEFWCPETNTFVFPWGEAAITLQDITILGGYPVLGKSVTSPLPGDLLKVEQELKCLKREMPRKATHDVWIKQCMEKKGELEHAAFLTLWLSRYVFPSLSDKTIGNHVFPIAAHLSRGAQLALAPAVLASLYRDLRLLREKAMAGSQSILVSAPFQLVQLWAFERFPLLGPETPNSLEPGQPRAARWQKINSKINLPLVRSALRLPENFLWRPYSADLKNWPHFSYYKETKQFISDCSGLDDELQSYTQSTRPSELVGIGCVEKYLPHRVAMQFGRKPAIRDVSVQKENLKKALSFSVQQMKKRNCHGSLVSEFSSKTRTQIIRDWPDEADLLSSSVHCVANKATVISKISSPIKAKNSKGDFHASVASRNPRIPRKISRVSKEIVNEERQDSQESVPPRSKNNLQRSSRKIISENCRKRKFSKKTEGSLQNKDSIAVVNFAAIEVERKASNGGGSSSDPLDFVLPSERIRQKKRSRRESVKVVGGEACDRPPVNVDGRWSLVQVINFWNLDYI